MQLLCIQGHEIGTRIREELMHLKTPSLVKWHGAPDVQQDFMIDRFDVRGELDWIDQV